MVCRDYNSTGNQTRRWWIRRRLGVEGRLIKGKQKKRRNVA